MRKFSWLVKLLNRFWKFKKCINHCQRKAATREAWGFPEGGDQLQFFHCETLTHQIHLSISNSAHTKHSSSRRGFATISPPVNAILFMPLSAEDTRIKYFPPLTSCPICISTQLLTKRIVRLHSSPRPPHCPLFLAET